MGTGRVPDSSRQDIRLHYYPLRPALPDEILTLLQRQAPTYGYFRFEDESLLIRLADIPCIVSNHEDLRYVADQFGIPYYVWSIKKDHSNKEEVEKAEMELLKKEDISFIVLARYMQIISDEMIAEYPHHIINIHHSFLPAFIGAKPYHQAYERGVKIIGATSHYVTAELDAGPIIEQDVTRITHKDTPESLVLKGKDLEKIVLSHAVSKHIQRKILTYKNKTIIFS